MPLLRPRIYVRFNCPIKSIEIGVPLVIEIAERDGPGGSCPCVAEIDTYFIGGIGSAITSAIKDYRKGKLRLADRPEGRRVSITDVHRAFANLTPHRV